MPSGCLLITSRMRVPLLAVGWLSSFCSVRLAKTGSCPPGCAVHFCGLPNGGFFFRAVSDQAAIVSSAGTDGPIDDNRASSAAIVALRFSRRAAKVLASIG